MKCCSIQFDDGGGGGGEQDKGKTGSRVKLAETRVA